MIGQRPIVRAPPADRRGRGATRRASRCASDRRRASRRATRPPLDGGAAVAELQDLPRAGSGPGSCGRCPSRVEVVGEHGPHFVSRSARDSATYWPSIFRGNSASPLPTARLTPAVGDAVNVRKSVVVSRCCAMSIAVERGVRPVVRDRAVVVDEADESSVLHPVALGRRLGATALGSGAFRRFGELDAVRGPGEVAEVGDRGARVPPGRRVGGQGVYPAVSSSKTNESSRRQT